ncbi:PREDICTED: UBN2_2 domain-containing [Prunus dulcis]|uniref:PREDICTED: UBN2_2 domain-containing n=1 Tax=Prunus dulcis TaxID=3755 RepID=A0A5E4GH79_PRUDU|nr:PREDICTED: UBN2_2 domain-containing [Prunus dulcis]
MEIALGFLDYDMALREEASAVIMKIASAEEKSYYAKWKEANRMAILIMLKSMSPSVRGGIEVKDNAKDFLESIALKYKKSEKAKTGFLMNQLIELKYVGDEHVRMHILKVINIGMKLRTFIELKYGVQVEVEFIGLARIELDSI